MLLARVHSGADRPEAVEHQTAPGWARKLGNDASAIVLRTSSHPAAAASSTARSA